MSEHTTDGTRPDPTERIRSRTLRTLIHEYKWIHIGLGLLGNLTFVVGSVMFLSESWKLTGTWLFIAGSTGMLIGSIGDALVEKERG